MLDLKKNKFAHDIKKLEKAAERAQTCFSFGPHEVRTKSPSRGRTLRLLLT